MFNKLQQNKFYFFIVKAGFLYGFCYILYEFVIKKQTRIDQLFIHKIIQICTYLLKSFGYKVFASKEINDFQVFGLDGSNGVWIGVPCNGITLMFLFSIFIISYPGKIINKLWYLPLGIFIVNFINIARIICLSIIALYYPQYLYFNHTYTFTFMAYSIVFLLWMVWVNKFSNPLMKNANGN